MVFFLDMLIFLVLLFLVANSPCRLDWGIELPLSSLTSLSSLIPLELVAMADMVFLTQEHRMLNYADSDEMKGLRPAEQEEQL